MKKILSIAFLIIFTNCVISQEFTARVGFNSANLNISGVDFLLESDFNEDFEDDEIEPIEDVEPLPLPGFHIGGDVSFPINDFLSMRTGVVLNYRGTRIEEEINMLFVNIEIDRDIRLFYIDIPLQGKVNYQLDDDLELFGLLGIYNAFGLFGKINTEIAASGFIDFEDSDEEDVRWGPDENEDFLRRYDFGLSFGGGIEYDRFELSAQYQFGLRNISSFQQNDVGAYNRLLNISLAYKF